MNYNYNEIEKKLGEEFKENKSDPKVFYKLHTLNNKGKDNHIKKVLPKLVLEKGYIDEFNNINKTTRKVGYIDQHVKNKFKKGSTCKGEAQLARMFFNEKIYFRQIGEIIDYQVPLKVPKSKENKGLGKIDLLFYEKKNNIVYLTELKNRTGNKDSLLKAILEIYTYYKLMDIKKLQEEIKSVKGIENYELCLAVLLEEDCAAYKDIEVVKEQMKDILKKICEQIKITVFSYKEENNIYLTKIEL
jgi:hypothetical protein